MTHDVLSFEQEILLCKIANMTQFYHCNVTALHEIDTSNIFSVLLFFAQSTSPTIIRVSIISSIIMVVQWLSLMYLHYNERKRLRKGYSILTWRKNVYYARLSLRIIWNNIRTFQVRQLIIDMWRLMRKLTGHDIELLANNIPLNWKRFGFKECDNTCGNKTLYNECLYCIYHKDTFKTMLPIQRDRIITILCAQRRAGTIWSTLPVCLVRNFAKNYI